MFNIAFYRDKDGNSEIIDFLDELQRKGKTSKTDRVNRIKILAYLQALKEYGTHIGQPIVKHIEGSLWELRPLKNRMFFFYWKDDTFVLLHHFIKKSQKTPEKEIEKARLRQKDFLKREEKRDEQRDQDI
jgi:phage-related protein